MIKTFNFEKLALDGAFLIDSFSAEDLRGEFIKDYSLDVFEQNGIDYQLKEVFYTVSKKGVIRALHFQQIVEQPKLVRCISGKIYDVIVDLRKDSSTFGQYLAFYLTGENKKSLLIPAGFGHGYLVLEDSIVSYKCAEPFLPEGDSGIMYDDSDLNIEWPFDLIGGVSNVILSDKDKSLMSFEEFKRIGN